MKKIYTTFITAFIAFSLVAQPCTKLFISEYVEGSGNNKALEIYNPTINSVNLSGYKLIQYNNGSDTARFSFDLSGTIAAGGVYIIANSQAGAFIKDLADSATTNGVFGFNGNDVIALLNGTDTLDRIGQIGDAADIIFGDSTGLNHTYVRQPSVQEGTTDWYIGNLQWIIFPRDTIRLGNHTMNPCAAVTDTIVSFSSSLYSFTGVNGSYNLNLVLNSNHDDVYSVDVEVKSGDASNINNYTTQTVTFSSGVTQANLPITITNDTTGGGANTIVFRLTNETGGVKIGEDSLFTLVLNAPAQPSSIITPGFDELGKLYPNPNNGKFFIELKNALSTTVTLYDVYGKTVYRSTESTSTFELNASHIGKGMYIVELKDGEHTAFTRINIVQ